MTAVRDCSEAEVEHSLGVMTVHKAELSRKDQLQAAVLLQALKLGKEAENTRAATKINTTSPLAP